MTLNEACKVLNVHSYEGRQDWMPHDEAVRQSKFRGRAASPDSSVVSLIPPWRQLAALHALAAAQRLQAHPRLGGAEPQP